jgi:hypothetical protein
MRSPTGTLASAAKSNDRYPIARLTVRDMLLRFSSYTIQANPYGASDNSPIGNDNGVYGDQVVTTDGHIVRVISDGSSIYVNKATPGTPSSWGTWTSLGLATMAQCQPGLSVSGNSLYLWFISTVGELVYCISTDYGSSWTAPIATPNKFTFSGPCTLAPIGSSLVYVSCLSAGGNTGHVSVYRCTVVSNVITRNQMPFEIFGDDSSQQNWLASGESYFDAETLNGVDYLILCDASRGRTWCVSYNGGCWGVPRWIIPDDYTFFVPYRLTLIQGMLWLTGQVNRQNGNLYSPIFDAYCYSNNGLDWTCLARNSYLGTAELRGKLHLPGDGYVYYSGIYTVQRAPASYLIDPAGDNASKKVVLSAEGGSDQDDIISVGCQYPSANTSPQLDFTLKSGDDGYLTGSKAAIVQAASEAWLEFGYKTTVGDEFLQIAHGSIDTPDTTVADATRKASFTARDACFKPLRDWQSPFYWELNSQRKVYDPCNALDRFAIQGTSLWNTSGPNQITNPDFTTDTSGWTNWATGSASGTRARSQDYAFSGAWSYKIEKSGGNNADQYGASTTITAQPGTTYNLDVQVECPTISGGDLTYTVAVSGNISPGNTAYNDSTTQTDVSVGWNDMALTFTNDVNNVAQTVTITIYLDNCTSGTIYIGEATCYPQSGSQISCQAQEDEQFLFSVESPIDDFDLMTEFADTCTAASDQLAVGLVGLAIDTNNLMALKASNVNGVKTLQLLKKRNATWTVLAQAPFSWAQNGTHYWLRFVHRGGHFWGYATAGSVFTGQLPIDFGQPLIDFLWTDTTDKPCNSTDGRGQIGLFVHNVPLRFHAFATDQYSELVCLRATSDLNWSSFPTSGSVIWDSERITFTDKTNGYHVVPAGLTWTEDCYYNGGTGLWIDNTAKHFGQAPYQWSHFVQSGLLSGYTDGQFDNHGVIFPSGQEAGAAWKVKGFVDNYNGSSFLTTDGDSGHANTNSIANGNPNWHGVLVLPSTFYLAPALLNCTRGANGTTATSHADNSLVYKYADDNIQFYNFFFFDGNEDWNNETLVKRMTAMPGSLSTATKQINTNASLSWSSLSAWVGHQVLDYNGLPFVSDDIDVSFQVTTPLENSGGLGIGYKGVWISLEYSNYLFSAGIWANNFISYPIQRYVVNIQPISGMFTVRLVTLHRTDGTFYTLYLNGQVAASFAVLFPPQGSSGLYIYGKSAQLAISNIWVPELYEWREFSQINNGEAVLDAFSRVLEDRPIWWISRSGNNLLFSMFMQRDNLGTYSNTVLQDETHTDDTQIYSWARVETADIIEQIDDTAARTYGLIHRSTSMPEVLTAGAAFMMAALLRRAQETYVGRSEDMAGDLAFENEDKFLLSYTASSTGLVVSQEVIVNDIQYDFGLANLVMTVGTRKWIS